MANHSTSGTTAPASTGAGDGPGNGTLGNLPGELLPDVASVPWFEQPENLLLLRIAGTLLALLLSWVFVVLVDRALTRSAGRIAKMRRLDEQRTRALVGRTKPMRFMIRLLMVTVFVIAVLGIWGLQTAFTGLLAGAGFAGIVIGLAAGDTIGDVIAGFLIFYNHPFDIGDWVEIDGVEGIIDDVALGATTLMTFDNEKVTYPNRLVEGAKVKNFSAKRKLRRRLQVGVEYGSHLGQAMAILVELANKHPEVFEDPAPTAVTKGFGASSVDLELRFFVEPVRSSAIKVYTDLLHQVHDTFRERGINIAFPHVQIVQSSAFRMAHEGGSEMADATPADGGAAA